jgi:hypothetical protein
MVHDGMDQWANMVELGTYNTRNLPQSLHLRCTMRHIAVGEPQIIEEPTQSVQREPPVHREQRLRRSATRGVGEPVVLSEARERPSSIEQAREHVRSLQVALRAAQALLRTLAQEAEAREIEANSTTHRLHGA